MSAGAPDRLQALYDFLGFLQSVRETDEQKVWARVLEKLSVALDAEAATYFVVWSKGRQLISHHALGVLPENLSRIPVDLGKGLCGWVAARREPALAEDAYKDARFSPDVDAQTGFKTRSALCVPLLDGLDLSGVLEFINKRAGIFVQGDLDFVQACCRQASVHLRALRLEHTLDKVTAYNASILENLTGGFLAVDIRGRVMLCNPAARRILELREDITTLQAEAALRHVAGLPELLMQTLATRQTVKRRELLWHHNAEPRILGYSTLLIQDTQGNLTGTGITFQDLTGLKR